MVGLIEAQDCFVGDNKEYNGIELLSISSLTYSKGKPTGWRKDRSFALWNDDLFNVMLNGQAQFAHYFLLASGRRSGGTVNYFRVESRDVSSEQQAFVNLDVTHEDALNLMQGKAHDMADLMIKREEVKHFFKTNKLYSNG